MGQDEPNRSLSDTLPYLAVDNEPFLPPISDTLNTISQRTANEADHIEAYTETPEDETSEADEYSEADEKNDELLEIKDTPEKGVGVFALKDIRAGDIVMAESPIIVMPTQKDLKKKIPRKDILAAYERLSDDKKEDFSELRTYMDYPQYYVPDKPDEPLRFDHESKFRWPWKRKKDPVKDQIVRRFRCNASVFVDPTTKQSFVAVHRFAQLFNHSCDPNTESQCDATGVVYCYAFADIRAGEELTICYNEILKFMTTQERNAGVLPILGMDFFTCKCALCHLPDPDRADQSDTRRALLRHILAMLSGRDLENMPSKLNMRQIKKQMGRERNGMQTENTLWLYFAELCYAEGMALADHARFGYLKAAMFILVRTYELGQDRLPEGNLLQMRGWQQKIQEITRILSTDASAMNEEVERMKAILDAVGPNGEIPPVITSESDVPLLEGEEDESFTLLSEEEENHGSMRS